MDCDRNGWRGALLLGLAVVLSSHAAKAVEDCSATANSSAAGCVSQACHEPEPSWFAQIDALFVTRDNASRNQPVVLTDDTGDTVLSTHDLSFDWNAGPRIFVGKYEWSCGGWEAGYFGINGSAATATARDPNNLDIPLPLSAVANDFDNANAMTLTWDWTLNNAEVNVFRDFEHFQILAGFRYLNLDEHFKIRTEDADGDVSDYPIWTQNNLFGAQLGGRAHHEWRKFGVNATGKAGIFGNNAVERQTVRDNNNETLLRNAMDRGTSAAFVGDLDLTLTYQITDHIWFRGGYYLLWVSQVALAPDQLDFSFNSTSGTHLDDSGSVFFHGATVGFQAEW
jgi:hypothetical protein